MLRFVYRLIEHHEMLMERAIEKATGSLKSYLEKHLEEERGHDEILKKDLENMGYTDFPMFVGASEMIGIQLFLIETQGPHALLGYMQALEAENPSIEAIEAIEEETGVKQECMRLHAELDKHHIVELMDVIGGLNEGDKAVIEGNRQYTLMKLENELQTNFR